VELFCPRAQEGSRASKTPGSTDTYAIKLRPNTSTAATDTNAKWEGLVSEIRVVSFVLLDQTEGWVLWPAEALGEDGRIL
jgi:hypothetical protein